MKIKRTIQFNLDLDKEQRAWVEDTLHLYSKAFQFCLDITWDEKITSLFKLYPLAYKELERFSLPANIRSTVMKKAAETMRGIAAIIRKGKKASKPTSEKVPVRLNINTVSFVKNKPINGKFDPKKEKAIVSFSTVRGRIRTPLKWYEYAKKFRSWDCKAGELDKDCNGNIVIRLIFEKEVEKPPRTGYVVGFNRGVKQCIVSSKNVFVDHHPWTEKERRYLDHIKRLQKNGSDWAKRRLRRKVWKKYRRFTNNCFRIFAKRVCEGLVPGDTIVLEDIKNIRKKCGDKGKAHKKHRRKMGRWRFSILSKFIEEVADMKGIYVEYVKAVDISVTCSRCGMVCSKNLKRQISLYHCASCGFNADMDINAARNVEQKWRMTKGYASGAPANRPIASGSSS